MPQVLAGVLLLVFAVLVGRTLLTSGDEPTETGFDSVELLPLDDIGTDVESRWEPPPLDRNPFDQNRDAVVVPSVDDDTEGITGDETDDGADDDTDDEGAAGDGAEGG